MPVASSGIRQSNRTEPTRLRLSATKSMSLSTSSSIDTFRRLNLSMSPYDKAHSVGALEFGRLSLENDSDAEMVETRSQKRFESSQSKDKGKSKAKAGSSSKTQDDRRKSRKTTSKGARKRPSDDDDDDSSSDDENEDPESSRRDIFRMMVSVLNADCLSPVEFADPNCNMSLRSKTLRVYADSMADHLNQSGREAVWAQNNPSSAAWGDMAYQNLERLKRAAEQKFVSGDADSIDTLEAFDRIYFSIHEMLVRPLYRNLHINAKRDFVFLLVNILNFIIRECRPRGGENTIAYAGSVQAQERNIYMRFITKPEVHSRYMRNLIGLSHRAEIRDMFRTTRVRESLVDTCTRIHYYIGVTPPALPVIGPLGNFSEILDQFLQRLGIPLPR